MSSAVPSSLDGKTSLAPRRGKCGSWACPGCAGSLGKALVKRLETAQQALAAAGLKIVMVTLTVARSQFASAREAYDVLTDRKAVNKAVRAWGRSRGLAKVEYLGKLELQEAGWPHWHVLLAVPADLKIRLPYAAAGKGGEFDAFWRYGYSNVRREGDFLDYASKQAFAGYVCKEAGNGGRDALEAAGLPAYGIHFLQPSNGWWGLCCVEPITPADAQAFDDEEASDDAGRLPGLGVTIGERPPRADTLVARVDQCGQWSVLVVDGALEDESRQQGTVWGRFGVVLPVPRRFLGQALDEWLPDSCEHFESGVVEKAVGLTRADVVAFFGHLAWRLGEPDWMVDLEAEVARRLGFCAGLPGRQARMVFYGPTSSDASNAGGGGAAPSGKHPPPLEASSSIGGAGSSVGNCGGPTKPPA